MAISLSPIPVPFSLLSPKSSCGLGSAKQILGEYKICRQKDLCPGEYSWRLNKFILPITGALWLLTSVNVRRTLSLYFRAYLTLGKRTHWAESYRSQIRLCIKIWEHSNDENVIFLLNCWGSGVVSSSLEQHHVRSVGRHFERGGGFLIPLPSLLSPLPLNQHRFPPLPCPFPLPHPPLEVVPLNPARGEEL